MSKEYRTFEEFWDGPNGTNTALSEKDRDAAQIGWQARDAELASQSQTIAELTAKLDAVRGKAIKWQNDDRWAKQFPVLIELECADELLAILDAPTKPKEAR